MLLSIAQLQMVLMAVPGLAVLLLAPSLLCVRSDSLARAMTPSALVCTTDSSTVVGYEMGTAGRTSTRVNPSVEYGIRSTSKRTVSYSGGASIRSRSQFLSTVGPSRAP